MRIVTAEQMKLLEAAAVEHDITLHRLMENAGSAAAAFIRRTINVSQRNCMVFCGTGNNGGDGFVVARKLFESDANVLIVLVGEQPASSEAKAMYNMAELMEIPTLSLATAADKILSHLGHADIIIDAVCGTGFYGKLSGGPLAACRMINDAIAAVFALDIPSGVVCDTGVPDENAVRADFTIAFDSLKPLHILPVAQEYCGVTETVEIGIPDAARDGIAAKFGTITLQTVLDAIPLRDPDSHKGDYGRLLVIAGSARYRGAAALCVRGALHAGVGIVELASTEAVCASVAAKLDEAIFLPLPQDAAGYIDAEAALEAVISAVKSADAVLFGCGLGTSTHALLAAVLENATCPVVLDADGINMAAENIHVLKKAKAPLILTPHPGEMSRLSGMPMQALLGERHTVAMRFAHAHNVTLVLKGHETVVASPDGGLLMNATGNAGLAKGGSGDFLAGMTAAFAAQGLTPQLAAACAVHLHGLAADRAAKRLSQAGMLPSDLAAELCAILAENGR